MHATLKQLETLNAALELRISALQRQVDEQDTRIASLVENVNLLRGDARRVAANGGMGGLREAYEPNPGAPVRRGRRPTQAEAQAARADTPGYERESAPV